MTRELPLTLRLPEARAILCRQATQLRRPVRFPADYAGWTNGQPGDRLWGREGFATRTDIDPTTELAKARSYLLYRNGSRGWDPNHWHAYGDRWLRAHDMPRWAARIWLTIRAVRTERLESISLNDARACGIPQMHAEAVRLGWSVVRRASTTHPDTRDLWDNRTSAENYLAVWDRAYRRRAPRDTNPWVWVVDFEPEPPDED
jgi:hypothetical protein